MAGYEHRLVREAGPQLWRSIGETSVVAGWKKKPLQDAVQQLARNGGGTVGACVVAAGELSPGGGSGPLQEPLLSHGLGLPTFIVG